MDYCSIVKRGYFSAVKIMQQNAAMPGGPARRLPGTRTINPEQERRKTKVRVHRMRQTLEEDSSLYKEQGWDRLWQEGVTPWDLNVPTPALASELKASKWPRQESSRLLIPGCGSGFDLISLACHQEYLQRRGLICDSVIVGVDISQTSLEQAKQVLTRDYQPKTDSPCITLVHGDFFDCSTWRSVYSSSTDTIEQNLTSCFQEGAFDLIYDYVFFCALPPGLRDPWGEAVSSLLKPGTGRLLTLMFPVLQNPELKGPPYPVTVEDYQKVLEPRHVVMDSEPYNSPQTVPDRVGKELVCWWTRENPSKL